MCDAFSWFKSQQPADLDTAKRCIVKDKYKLDYSLSSYHFPYKQVDYCAPQIYLCYSGLNF